MKKLKISVLFLILIVFACNREFSVENENIKLVNKYYEAVNNGDTTFTDELVTADFTKINNDKESETKGPKLLSTAIRGHLKNNKEYKFIIDDIYSTKDKVTVRWRWESINIKYGYARKVVSQGISIFKINYGKIDTLWQMFDLRSFFEQLGIN